MGQQPISPFGGESPRDAKTPDQRRDGLRSRRVALGLAALLSVILAVTLVALWWNRDLELSHDTLGSEVAKAVIQLLFVTAVGLVLTLAFERLLRTRDDERERERLNQMKLL